LGIREERCGGGLDTVGERGVWRTGRERSGGERRLEGGWGRRDWVGWFNRCDKVVVG